MRAFCSLDVCVLLVQCFKKKTGAVRFVLIKVAQEFGTVDWSDGSCVVCRSRDLGKQAM